LRAMVTIKFYLLRNCGRATSILTQLKMLI